ncbi:MAG TPA: hypothetical protein VK658_26785 [Chryseolinea sp.]|nr:hypothetical protein [Chryseolinea sp.]
MTKPVLKFIFDLAKFSMVACAGYVFLVLFIGDLAIRQHILPITLLKNIHFKYGIKGRTLERLAEAQTRAEVDILFLGSSHSFTGFDPRIFQRHGYSTFNLGTNSQTPLQSRYLIERYLNELSPKLVVYEAYPSMLCSDGVESALDILSNEQWEKQSLQLVTNHRNIKVINTALFSFYMQVAHPNNQKGSSSSGDVYVGYGYVEPEPKHYHPKPIPSEQWQINENQVNALKEFRSFIVAHHIPCIAVQAPISNTLRNARTNEAEFDARMESIGIYVNFNKRLQLLDTVHFADNNHLNKVGVNEFNNKFISWLDSTLVRTVDNKIVIRVR